MQGKGWKSRKLIVALVGAVLPVVNQVLGLGLPVEAIVTSIVSLIGFIAGETVIDAARAKRAA
jgi:uncharacterized membrane protein